MSTSDYNKKYYEENKVEILVQKKEQRKVRSEEVKARDREQKRAWRAANPEKYKSLMRAWRLANPEKFKAHLRKSNYGITDEQYKKQLSDQNNKCAICFSVFIKTPHVDHNHKTMELRGLLCNNCNTGIGKLRESVEILNSAIRYVQKYNKELQ